MLMVVTNILPSTTQREEGKGGERHTETERQTE